MHLEGKTAVITGTTAGLGLSFSEALIARGALVYGLARREDKLRDVEGLLGERFRGIVCDVSKENAVVSAFEEIAAASETVDILVNNAGLGRFGPVDSMTVEDWDIQMEINLRGVFLCTRAVVPIMKHQNEETGFGGHIVNIASVAGLIGNPNLSAYNATKFGLRGFSEAIMKEVRYDGIKVTCLNPGSVQTDFGRTGGVELSPHAVTPDEIASTLVHVLETSDNYLISEVAMRPLRPKG